MTSVLIVLLGALGDVVRGFSVLPPLRQTFPNVRITWLVEPKCRGIVALHPMVDEVVVFERPTFEKVGVRQILRSFRSVRDIRSELQSRSFDVVLDMQRHSKSGFLSWISGASRRIGFHPRDAKEGNWLFNTEYTARADPYVSKVYHYQQFLDVLGVARGDSVRFGLREAVVDDDIPPEVSSLPKPLVSIVMGSMWESKNWPFEGYVLLVQKLLRHSGASVVLVGDRSQAALAERVQSGVNDVTGRLCSTAGRTSLRELIAILKASRLAIGPDSGPGHIAAAVDTPYVGLFGPTTEERVAPFGQEELVVRVPIGCAPCMKRVCPGLDTLCMKFVSPEMVWERAWPHLSL